MTKLIAILFRRQLLMAGVFLTVFVSVIAVTLVMPKQYESRMKILVKNDRADLLVSPDLRNGGFTMRSEVGESRVNSEIELLTSNDLLVRVVKACRLYTKQPDTMASTTGEQDEETFDKAVRRLRRDLKIAPVRKSDVIQISYISSRPENAAQVLRELTAAYLDAHLSMHGAAGTQAFFKEQASRYEVRLRNAENALRDFRFRNSISSITEQRDLLLRKVFDSEASLREAETGLAEAGTRVGELVKHVGAQERRVVTQSRSIPNQYSVERLHTMLTELQNRRSQVAMKFRPEDRIVVEIDQEIANTRAALDSATKLVSVEQATDVNPLRTAFEGDLTRAQLQLSSLQSRRDSLARLAASYRTRLASLESVTTQESTLQRAVKESEENYLLFTRKQEEAHIADSLDQQKIANVAFVEAPMVQHLPVRPSIPLNLSLGLFAALFLSLGAIFCAEFLSSSFHTPAEVESAMGIPVLATVPLEL